MTGQPWTATHVITGRRAYVRPHPSNASLLLAQFHEFDHPHAHDWWAYSRDRFEPHQAPQMFNPAENSPATAFQMAAIMILKGSSAQALEALYHLNRGRT